MMNKFKVIKDKDSFAIYKCWLWQIQDEKGIWVGSYNKKIPPYFASKEKSLIALKNLNLHK